MRVVAAAALGFILVATSSVRADEPEVWTTVSARKHGQTFGPFPAVEGAAYLMPGVMSCAGWTDTVESSCSGFVECSSSTVAYVRQKGDGCELFVLKHRETVKLIDLEHDPRVRRFSGDAPVTDDE